MRVVAGCLFFVLAQLSITLSAGAQGVEAVVPRRILALYDGAVEPTPTDTQVHALAESILDHLGYVVEYHDLATGLPQPDRLEGTAAILTMLTYDVRDSSRYLAWLGRQARTVPRILVLGQFGGPLTEANRRSLAPVLDGLGLRLTSDYVGADAPSRIVTLDRRLVGFESEVNPIAPGHPLVTRRRGGGAEVALEYETELLGRRVRSTVLATGPRGAYAASGVLASVDPVLRETRWIVDPFEFVHRALGVPRFPIPDVTTVSGRRIYVAQMAGDGWNDGSAIGADEAGRPIAAEVATRELVAAFPDLPITVGVTLGDLEDGLGGGKRARDAARALFALPQVEVASATATRPLRWSFFDHYDRAEELRLVAAADGASRGVFGRIGAAVTGSGSRNRLVADGRDLPRAYLQTAFDLDSEIAGALRETATLAPPGKAPALYLWSGDALPGEAAIRATREAGIGNLSGGEMRFDPSRSSVADVAPLARKVGAERQVYALAGSENSYTKSWTDQFGAYRRLADFFRRTEEPRRLKGVGLGFHAYSASRAASLGAVKELLSWAETAPLAPIRSSLYAAMVEGFFTTRIVALDVATWRIEHRGALRTLRFDALPDQTVDLPRSHGVLGSNRVGDRLYVSLDPDVPVATLALRDRSMPQEPADLANAALTESRWQISRLVRGRDRLAFTAEGFGQGDFLWAGMPAGAWHVTARRDGRVVAQAEMLADADGVASVSLSADARSPLEIAITRRDATEAVQ
ncbi:hypothetical protein GCM10011390_06430 [Aureimonas endophytica]|uniref:Polysaccharide deacetylase n=1 Tax=Aureimonas endophytica TaxID=2027858 RepID=A0A916ZER7_9HYPH|nr:hypothetical protein [Aureimonas endophytica]GGD90378.1 hypothetical protein GCM10011390_06430 [Aureimonas endophytica]